MAGAAQSSAAREEQIAETVTRMVADRVVGRVVVQTHYGSLPLEVAEVWEHEGVLYLGVLADPPPSP